MELAFQRFYGAAQGRLGNIELLGCAVHAVGFHNLAEIQEMLYRIHVGFLAILK
jgi:hypothetical protein